ncbi:hypothetical protein BC835DRAFT_1328654 [Cytidiella melzeri]|nr:hypothetical protein BC835DRAFT_1328654 [Cytidiella melzeri]
MHFSASLFLLAAVVTSPSFVPIVSGTQLGSTTSHITTSSYDKSNSLASQARPGAMGTDDLSQVSPHIVHCAGPNKSRFHCKTNGKSSRLFRRLLYADLERSVQYLAKLSNGHYYNLLKEVVWDKYYRPERFESYRIQSQDYQMMAEFVSVIWSEWGPKLLHHLEEGKALRLSLDPFKWYFVYRFKTKL